MKNMWRDGLTKAHDIFKKSNASDLRVYREYGCVDIEWVHRVQHVAEWPTSAKMRRRKKQLR